MEPMIRVEKVSKRFITKGGPVDALENISFEVEK